MVEVKSMKLFKKVSVPRFIFLLSLDCRHRGKGMIFKFYGPSKSEREQVHPHHWLADPACGMLLMRWATKGCRTFSALHPARRPVANEAKHLKRNPMITLRRKMDDGEGNVYIVQQGSFTRLAAFIHRLNKDQGLHISPQLDTAGFEALILGDAQLAGQVQAWIHEHLPTQLDLHDISPSKKVGQEVDVWEIWGH